ALKDDVPQKVKQERADAIMELQSGISYELNQKKVGKTFKVLFDKTEGDYTLGRTEFDSPEVDNEVIIQGADKSLIGQFKKVKIESADHYDLVGKIVQ
ncbi:MAG: TRAM domain-containing protein, partial [Crocinitomicaceae bacterium]|nr:TRAM domain-containing protein [Crocinitomicaceae bacterium]